MHRRSLAVALIASIVLGACSLGSIAAPYSLIGPLRIDVSGLPVNLIIPLVNNTGFNIYSFCIVLTTESDEWLPTFYAVAVQRHGSSGRGWEDDDFGDFGIDESGDGDLGDPNEYSSNATDYYDNRGNVTWLRAYGALTCVPRGAEFQLRMEGGDFGDEYGSRYDLFPAGTTLTINPCDSVDGPVYVGAP